MHLLPDHMSVFNYSITHRMGGGGWACKSALPVFPPARAITLRIYYGYTVLGFFWGWGGVKKETKSSISVLRTFCNTHLPLLCYK